MPALTSVKSSLKPQKHGVVSIGVCLWGLEWGRRLLSWTATKAPRNTAHPMWSPVPKTQSSSSWGVLQQRTILCFPHGLWLFSLPVLHQFSSGQSLSHVQLFATHGLQHSRLPCLSPSPRACSNSYPLSQWCDSIISSSVIPFSSCLQSFPASGSFPVSQFFTSGGQSVLELPLQRQSFQWMFRTDFL